ncbi:hypothetical protein Pmgp_00641 [Pelotomaculum propionicicum]|uniref:Uncharacterized protein n=1 Tax=Pelotomaculum propionicicum TaxID=258475 RepID=A0A4Y7RVX2_9FIRM|nr:hypothetical protein Pmgp_00641 [Pelotomaculum propionicicum]
MEDDSLLTKKKGGCPDSTPNLNLGVSCEIGPISNRKRLQEAYRIRLEAAQFQRALPLPGHPCNGDENLYPNKIGNFSKALPHNQLGEVILAAYSSLIGALSTGDPEEFEFIPLGGSTKLVDPQAAYDVEHLHCFTDPGFFFLVKGSVSVQLLPVRVA